MKNKLNDIENLSMIYLLNLNNKKNE